MKNTIVVEIRGGAVQAVYTNTKINVVLIDWDQDMEDEPIGVIYDTERLSDMPLDTIAV